MAKQALRTQYDSPGAQWQLRFEFYALTQTEKLSQYINELEILCHQQVDIKQETKLYHFVNEPKPDLNVTLLLQQLRDIISQCLMHK